MKNKQFDCVQMKRKSQMILYDKIKNMTRMEELKFWQNATIELRKQQGPEKDNKQATEPAQKTQQ